MHLEIQFKVLRYNNIQFSISEKCNNNDECQNGAVCEKSECKCLPKTSGIRCENIDCGEINPACTESGGQCEYDVKGKKPVCKCPADKVFKPQTRRCEEKCNNNDECQNGAVCEKSECKCLPKTSGIRCENIDCGEINPACTESGGQCEYNVKGKKPVCKCSEGKIFDPQTNRCEEDHCASSPCENGGTCKNEKESYRCLCEGRFGGTDCEKEVCLKEETKKCKNLTCVYDKVLNKGSCVCKEGEEFDPISVSCKEIDVCFLKTINNDCSKPHEICKDGKCQCEENYKYSKDKKSCEENFCKTKDPCPRNSICTELGSGKVLCVCNDGFYQKGKKCVRVNHCSPGLSKCEQLCNKTNGECGCHSSFALNEDKATCKLKKGQGPGCNLECGVGTCVKGISKDKCICPEVTHHFNGTTCIDLCTHQNFTLSDGMCPTNECEPDDKHVFRCKCRDPYEQADDGIHCKRKMMCEDEKVVAACAKKSAICKDLLTGNGYECICDVGFVKEKGVCVRTCDAKVNHDKCASLRATCELNSNYEVVCKCPPMLKQGSKDGPCDTIEKNSYTGKLSILKTKYEVRDTRRRFRRSTDEIDFFKLREDIRKSMSKTYGKTTGVKILHCDVEGHLVSCTLELQLEDEYTKSVNIISSQSICLPLDDEYCLLKPNLIMEREDKRTVFTKAKACQEEVKTRLCGKSTNCTEGENGDFQCRCRKGFEMIGSYHPDERIKATFIQICNDIDECTNSSSCPKTTDCVNNFGSYDCFCKDGYKKKNAKSDPKKDGCDALCDPNPCSHGECVVVGQHGFSCNCTDGYTGILCNTTASVRGKEPESSKKAAVVGGALGAILIVMLIVGVVVYVQMKKSKNYDEESARNRQKDILSNRLGREQPRFDNDRVPGLALRDSGERRRDCLDQRNLPRLQTTRIQDDNLESRRGYSDSEMPGRSYERSSRLEAKD